MANKTISDSTLLGATTLLGKTLLDDTVEQANIEYFYTEVNGEPAFTFKVTYEDKTT